MQAKEKAGSNVREGDANEEPRCAATKACHAREQLTGGALCPAVPPPEPASGAGAARLAAPCGSPMRCHSGCRPCPADKGCCTLKRRPKRCRQLACSLRWQHTLGCRASRTATCCHWRGTPGQQCRRGSCSARRRPKRRCCLPYTLHWQRRWGSGRRISRRFRHPACILGWQRKQRCSGRHTATRQHRRPGTFRWPHMPGHNATRTGVHRRQCGTLRSRRRRDCRPQRSPRTLQAWIGGGGLFRPLSECQLVMHAAHQHACPLYCLRLARCCCGCVGRRKTTHLS